MAYRSSAPLITILADFFIEIDKFILKFRWNCKGTRIPKATLEKKSKVGRLTLPHFKTYYTATVIRQFGTHIIDIDGWKRTESPEINPYLWSTDFQHQCQDHEIGKE